MLEKNLCHSIKKLADVFPHAYEYKKKQKKTTWKSLQQ